MMDLKLWFSILMVCGMAESLILAKDWHINVPSRIPVLQNSCVVIPCVYSYPKTKKILNRFRAFWYKRHTLVASNFEDLTLRPEYLHRTRMGGSIQSGNCTWELYGVRKTDTGPFYFKIEIPQHKSFTFSNNKVTLDIYRVPKPPVMTLEVSNKVTATCKVTHVCPSSPPYISWSRAGTWSTISKQENTWLWSTTSTMTFTPREADFNKRLECTVRFQGRKTAKGSVLVLM
ncbi:sialic acid-binding Ig-like lectin 14 isoform X3 [Poecilia reticulata]|uniref:sialic acid-binding Ig-like lectin 14 isoform X3 n=1 Tax=Poecilia reticulata TaxID=8081 RepID=UPI0007EBD08E|nr:PREDICTED: sialic acid-binding Ig-like lectin 14 isoform X3 [Poecilia reticulata]